MGADDPKITRRKGVLGPPPTRATACADEIRKRILDGEFGGGMALRQDMLAEQFGISRIPVREALLQLEAEGLLKIHPHRGAIVTEISTADIRELYEFRALLEPHLLEKSAPLLTRADFSELRKLLAEYSGALHSPIIERWGALNTQLHALLYSHANSPRIEATVNQLLQSTDRFTRMQLAYTHEIEQAEREHQMIVDLCEQKEISAAAELLRGHIHKAGELLTQLIEKRVSPSV